jgi:hypothetical protein
MAISSLIFGKMLENDGAGGKSAFGQTVGK